jgi:peptidyl-prolyl cis-trans isomerase SurA
MVRPRSLFVRFAAALVLATLTALPAVAPAQSSDGQALEPIDRIVAIVNDSVILASELRAEIERTRRRLQRQGNQVPPADVLRKRVLDRLIDERVQLERAQRRGISVDESQRNNALRRIAEQRGTDLAGLRQRYQRSGRSFAELREQIRQELVIQRLRQRAVASQIKVSDQEVADFVDRLSKASAQRAQYRLRHILIELPAEPTSQQVRNARERAQGVVERLQPSADFAALATRISDGPRALEGGDLGWRSRAELPSLFLDAIKGIDPGGIAGPVRSPNGFHVLKLVDQRGGQDQSVIEHEVRHILLRGNDAQARSALSSMRGRLREGEARFAELARQRSQDPRSAEQGGSLGWIGPGDMSSAFLRVVNNMDVGEVSEPFRSPMGWHLVEVTDRRQRSDVEAYRRAQARQTLYQRKRKEETQRWLQKLRDEAFIDKRLNE